MVSAQIGGCDDEDARYTTSANERLDEGHELQGLAQAWLVREQSPAPANGAKKPPDAVGLVGHQHLRTVHGSARVIQLREVARAGKRGMRLDTAAVGKVHVYLHQRGAYASPVRAVDQYDSRT